MRSFAVIVAGGRGKRVGGDRNKCLMKLAGREIVAWSIAPFERSDQIDGIVCIMGDEDERLEVERICRRERFQKMKHVAVTGGELRQEGVWTGLELLSSFSPDDDDIVLIHNGANPMVQQQDIEDVIAATKEYGAAVAAQPVKDTIKKVARDGLVIETLERSELWAMQTPQAMRYGISKLAFDRAAKDGFIATDDVALVEHLGMAVKVVRCSNENIKITSKEDLLFAERILNSKVKL